MTLQKLNLQKYLPFGMEDIASITNMAELNECIKMQTPVSARVIEYDISSKQYTLLCGNIQCTMYNEYFEKKNTAASMVGMNISVVLTQAKDVNGRLICKLDPRHEDAKKTLHSYENGTKLIGKVVTILQYGAIIDIGLGAASILHINQIKELHGENICNPSEVMSIGDIIEVYVNNTDDGLTKFSLISNYKETSAFSLISFFKNKLVS